MANLTIAIDGALLQRARIRALRQGTSVNAVLRDYLEVYAGASAEQTTAAANILRLSESSRARHDGPRWSRSELHDR